MSRLRPISEVAKTFTRQVARRRDSRRFRRAIYEQHHPGRFPQVIIWIASARKAVALGDSTLFKLWSYLRHVDRGRRGEGILSVGPDELRDAAQACGLSAVRVRVLLAEGDHQWWQRMPGARVRLFSQERVAAALTKRAGDAGLPDFHEVDVRMQLPLESLAGNALAWQGSLLELWLGKYRERGLTIIWDNLTALWGHSRGQLRRWIQAVALRAHRNFGMEDIGKAGTYTWRRSLPLDGGVFGFDHCWETVYKGRSYLNWERGRTYFGKDGRTATRGRSVKVNRAIDSCAGDFGAEGRIAYSALCPRPEHPFGLSAGQRLSEYLETRDRTGGSATGLLDAWNKLLAMVGGRILARRMNYVDGRSFARQRARRRDETLYWLRRRIFVRGQWWGAWSCARPLESEA